MIPYRLCSDFGDLAAAAAAQSEGPGCRHAALHPMHHPGLHRRGEVLRVFEVQFLEWYSVVAGLPRVLIQKSPLRFTRREQRAKPDARAAITNRDI